MRLKKSLPVAAALLLPLATHAALGPYTHGYGIKSLGLGKINRYIELEHTDALTGAIRKIQHLVKVEEIYQAFCRTDKRGDSELDAVQCPAGSDTLEETGERGDGDRGETAGEGG